MPATRRKVLGLLSELCLVVAILREVMNRNNPAQLRQSQHNKLVARNNPFPEDKDVLGGSFSNAATVQFKESNHDSNSQNKTSTQTKKLKLGFVHIPKTGGTSIEMVGANAGVPWGKCMFGPAKYCKHIYNPKHTRHWHSTKCADWHLPMKCGPNAIYEGLFEEFFVVVRNPYTRMLSEYYWAANLYDNPTKTWKGGPKRTKKNRNDPAFMNKWIQHFIVRQINSSNPHCAHIACGHFVPQYDFLQGPDGGTRVKHVLRLESLSEDFKAMMTTLGLQDRFQLPEKGNARGKDSELTINDMDSTTKQLIQTFYSKDFELGNYSIEIAQS